MQLMQEQSSAEQIKILRRTLVVFSEYTSSSIEQLSSQVEQPWVTVSLITSA